MRIQHHYFAANNGIFSLKNLLVFIFLTGIFISALASSNKSDWFPLGKEAWLTSSFSESRGTRYHAGFDYSTNMQTGWPVIAPTDGRIIRIRFSPLYYGKAIYFQSTSGVANQYVFAHLSGYAAEIDQLVESRRRNLRVNHLDWRPGDSETLLFRKGDTLAWSGATGIGSPHLHLEVRNPAGNTVLNPMQTEPYPLSGDSIAPRLLAAAVINPSVPELKQTMFYSDSAIISQSAMVMPAELHPNSILALKIVDYSRKPEENPMSIASLRVSCNEKSIYHKKYTTQRYGKMDIIQKDLAWAEEGGQSGDWHSILPLPEHKSIRGTKKNTSELFKHCPERLDVVIRDFAGNSSRYSLNYIPADLRVPGIKNPVSSGPGLVYQDSAAFTFLNTFWLRTGMCKAGYSLLALSQPPETAAKSGSSETGRLYADTINLCTAESPSQLPEFWDPAALVSRYKNLTILLYNSDRPQIDGPSSSRDRVFRLYPLPASGGQQQIAWGYPGTTINPEVPQKMRELQKPQSLPDSIKLELNSHPYAQNRTLALHYFWATDSTGDRMELHPKGLYFNKDLKLCLQGSGTQRLFYLGETTRKWWSFSTSSDSLGWHCAQADDMRDLALFTDTIPPQPGIPYWGKTPTGPDSVAALIIPITEKGSGIVSGNDLHIYQGNQWIPCFWDDENSILSVLRKNIPANSTSLQLKTEDDFNNKGSYTIQLPP